MRQRSSTPSFVVLGLGLGAGLATAARSPAATIGVLPTSRGFIDSTGAGTPGNFSYNTGLAQNNAGAFVERRSFFSFSVPSLGGPIVGASIEFARGNFTSPDASETLRLFDVSTPAATLAGATGGTAAFNDLGSGAVYGEYVAPRPGAPLLLSVNLAPEVIPLLAAAAGTADQFSVGAALVTLSPAAIQQIFGSTGFSNPADGQVVLKLNVDLVPLPNALNMGALSLAGIGMAVVARRGRVRAS